jgi:flagellar basal body-associated protein FliL
MKQKSAPLPAEGRVKGLTIIYRITLLVLLVLTLLIVSGSLYAILRPSESGPLFRLGGNPEGGSARARGSASGKSGSSEDGSPNGVTEGAVFNGIGRLRIPVAGKEASLLVVSIAFPYPANDSAFTEELASKIISFRTLATEYFSSLPAVTVQNLNEDAAKAELLKRFNGILRLGKIQVLYFNDLMLIE